MKSSGFADSKTIPGFDNWPRFVVIEQTKYPFIAGVKESLKAKYRTLSASTVHWKYQDT